mmetsp:Transcript_3647/g.8781  ORF Transcript_3647/g.8781 Transcript_3647/m.8781 type:complete len:281 (+) Transcript_3647:983-1825(+)
MVSDFAEKNNALLHLDGDGAAWAKSVGEGLLGGLLEVARGVVAAVEDDEVLDPRRDEQLAARHVAEVAGPEEAAGAVPADARAEGVLRGCVAVKVAQRHRRAAHAHLALSARRRLGQLAVRELGGDDDVDADALREGEAASAERPRVARGLGPEGGDKQAVLSEAVGVVERVAGHPHHRRRLIERLELGGLCADDRERERRAVVVALEPALAQPPARERDCEVGRDRERGAEALEGGRPEAGVLEPVEGRERVARILPVVQRAQHREEPHVVVLRRPADV